MELWEMGFGAGILGVFAIFMIVLAIVSHEDRRANR